MSASLKRFAVLTKKNILVIGRSPISTAIRALLLPLLIVLILSFSKELFNSQKDTYGIAKPTPVSRSLSRQPSLGQLAKTSM